MNKPIQKNFFDDSLYKKEIAKLDTYLYDIFVYSYENEKYTPVYKIIDSDQMRMIDKAKEFSEKHNYKILSSGNRKINSDNIEYRNPIIIDINTGEIIDE